MSRALDVKETATAVANGLIESMTPEIIAQVTMELIDRVSSLQMPRLDAVREDAEEEGDGEGDFSYFECPHCFAEIQFDDVYMVDIEIREIESHEVDTDADVQTLYFDTDNSGSAEDFHLKCGRCGLYVAMPDGWDMEWR